MPTRFWGSRADNSDLCVTQIPNRTFAMPYVSRPFRSHARSKTHIAAALPDSTCRLDTPS